MLSEANLRVLDRVQISADSDLEAWWKRYGLNKRDSRHYEGVDQAEWYILVVSELIYRGFCFHTEKGKECADRDVPVAEMCPGCKGYWVRAAEIACKSTQQWVAECAADFHTMRPNKTRSHRVASRDTGRPLTRRSPEPAAPVRRLIK